MKKFATLTFSLLLVRGLNGCKKDKDGKESADSLIKEDIDIAKKLVEATNKGEKEEVKKLLERRKEIQKALENKPKEELEEARKKYQKELQTAMMDLAKMQGEIFKLVPDGKVLGQGDSKKQDNEPKGDVDYVGKLTIKSLKEAQEYFDNLKDKGDFEKAQAKMKATQKEVDEKAMKLSKEQQEELKKKY